MPPPRTVTVLFSGRSAVQLPRLVLSLSVIILLAAAASVATGGLTVSIIFPAAVVFGMGLYYNGAQRYDVMEDRILTVGILGQRELFFEKIHAFVDAQPESFTSRFQSLLSGAPISSAIEVNAQQSWWWSQQRYLWVQDREAFLSAAREALAARRARLSP